MNLANLLRQHEEILEMTNKIIAYKTEQQIKQEAFNISLLLGQLSGKIKMHLSTEDRCVYPKLMNHVDKKAQDTSKIFAAEMGDLAATFDAFKGRYLGASKIADNSAAFLTESKTVFSALTKRIERENCSLYPYLK